MPKSVPELTSAPAPIGPYSVVTEANGFVFVSGQTAIDPTGGSTPEDVGEQTRMIMENLGSILGDVGLGYDDVVKTTIFLEDIADFGAVNEVYGSYFGAAPPARSTVQAGALPGGGRFDVEIEVIAAR
jgi:2-iminobutanoate/2-iminopropanoate deaminase